MIPPLAYIGEGKGVIHPLDSPVQISLYHAALPAKQLLSCKYIVGLNKVRLLALNYEIQKTSNPISLNLSKNLLHLKLIHCIYNKYNKS